MGNALLNQLEVVIDDYLLAGLFEAMFDFMLLLPAGAMVFDFIELLPMLLFDVEPIFEGDDIGVAVFAGTTTAVLLAGLLALVATLTLVAVPPHAIPIAVIARSEPVAMILFIL